MIDKEWSTEAEQPLDSYTLPEKNIIECGPDSEIFNKLPRALKELPWPVELQGSGRTERETKEFKVWYPTGDTVLSSITIIHELGHLRQADYDEFLETEREMTEEESYRATIAREKDAWQRGWERVKEHCPEFIDELEQKAKGKLGQFDDVKGLYDWLNRLSIFINEAYFEFSRDKLGTEDGDLWNMEADEVRGKYIVDKIRGSEFYFFFQDTDKFRIGESIDSAEAKKFIRKMAVKIAEEKV